MIDLKKRPFGLKDKEEAWVRQTLVSMTIEEKVGQLLCPQLSIFDDNLIRHLTEDLHVGAVMIRPFEEEGLRENIEKIQKMSKIPLLVSANLENGANGAIYEEKIFANPMGCAATQDPGSAYRLGKVSCAKPAYMGVNWGFAPIIDIDQNYHNPITNVRTFGANPDQVLTFAREYCKAAKEEGVAPTIKHFPGDGRDERDQHLLVSVNDASYKQWGDTYGRIYQTLIDEGAPAVMAAHIAAPHVVEWIEPDAGEKEKYLPASQSKILLTKLLRGILGFNGLVVTDSTLMVGYMQSMPRHKAVPYTIECGADMILFNRQIEEDVQFLLDGVKNGILSRERLDEAVTRILATKAAQGLLEERERGEILAKEEVAGWRRQVADEAVTLVKDKRGLLPLSADKTKRIYLNVIEDDVKNESPFALDMKKRFEREGFAVTLRKRAYNFDPKSITLENITPEVNEALEETMCSTEDFVKNYDMAVLILNLQTASNATVVRVNWNVIFGMGNDLPWYAGEMPLVVVSVNNPYHLLDIPMAHTYINTYTNNEETLDALMDKLMGRSAFKGVSPVDAFCGKGDTRL